MAYQLWLRACNCLFCFCFSSASPPPPLFWLRAPSLPRDLGVLGRVGCVCVRAWVRWVARVRCCVAFGFVCVSLCLRGGPPRAALGCAGPARLLGCGCVGCWFWRVARGPAAGGPGAGVCVCVVARVRGSCSVGLVLVCVFVLCVCVCGVCVRVLWCSALSLWCCWCVWGVGVGVFACVRGALAPRRPAPFFVVRFLVRSCSGRWPPTFARRPACRAVVPPLGVLLALV